MQKGNRRLLTIESPNDRLAPLERKRILKQIEGGWIVQTEEPPIIDWASAKTVTERAVTNEEIDSMKFAVRVCEQVKSNAIVMVQGLATVGIGPGQTSRVEAVRIAARRAGERAKGSVLASDAFFPFADGLEQAAEAGASAIVQPGGSIRDQEVIDAANRLGNRHAFYRTQAIPPLTIDRRNGSPSCSIGVSKCHERPRDCCTPWRRYGKGSGGRGAANLGHDSGTHKSRV